MRCGPDSFMADGRRRGSVLVIVLWIAFGLVALTLFFAQSMNFELRTADNRVAELEAEQAISGAARYVRYVLGTYATNGVMPDTSMYASQAVPVGDAHFWLIGRDTNVVVGPGELCFGLVDEGSKLNLNTASSNMVTCLPWITDDLANAILDWRDTNGGAGTFQTYYAMQRPSYQQKNAPFDTVDELRLLYGADLDVLQGEDLNRNGVLDPNEPDLDKNGQLDAGLLDYVTVYSREPNTYSNGLARINIRTLSSASSELSTLLQNTLGSRGDAILQALGLSNPSGGTSRNTTSRTTASGGRVTTTTAALTFASPLQFYLYCHQNASMTLEEFGQIAQALTVVSGTNNTFIEGRVNVNTASAAVLACLPGISDQPDLAQTLVEYRAANGDKLTSVAWIADALGTDNNSTVETLAASDCITTESYQFTADIAAIGHYGRGYRRVRYVFDVSDGTPKIIYRQDLTHLGWALGKAVRDVWLTANTTK